MKDSPARIVLPELLDELPPQDRHAVRSRHDLRRLNQWMNHPKQMARILSDNLKGEGTRHIVELGAGDGHFLFSVARRLRGQWQNANATLVDRLNAVDPAIINGFKDLGWRANVQTMSASDWLQQSPPNTADAIIANLFLHHFQAAELGEMFQLAAHTTRLLVALEPRRSWLPRLFGNLLWAIRCNSVTRHDAGVSIRAGFSGRELTALWPDKQNWVTTERSMGLFSHLFIARRKN